MIDQFNLPNIQLLQRLGYEVHVACNFQEGNTCDMRRIKKLKKRLFAMHVVCYQWDCPRSLWPVWECGRAYQQIHRLMQQNHYAMVHCHSPIGGAAARIAAHREGIAVIYTAHGFHFYRGAPVRNWALYYPAEKLLSYWTDILVTVNLEDYRFAERHLKAGKVFYIPGIGIDTAKFRKQARSKDFCRTYKIPEHAIVLLSVGELSKRKNHQIVMQALARMSRKDVYYLICGQGALYKELEEYAKRLGVAGRVRMPGYQEDLSLAYQNADIFVFPSLQEGMPAALMEAMAVGLPCVVSDIRGNRELIGQDGGAKFKIGHLRPSKLRQSKQLEKALARLIENEKLRNMCGAENRKQIEAYELSAVQKRMEVIYMEVFHADGCMTKEKERLCLRYQS